MGFTIGDREYETLKAGHLENGETPGVIESQPVRVRIPGLRRFRPVRYGPL